MIGSNSLGLGFSDRLDAAESAFFKRELEAIDQRVYQTLFAAYKARRFLPTQDGVSEADHVYTWRLYTSVGKAVFVGAYGQDAPRAEVSGVEESTLIKPIVSSYGYNLWEIKAAAKMGRPLDPMKAIGARRAIEELVDETLALGNTAQGLVGMIKIPSGTTSFTPSTKAAGGLTWGTMQAPNATGEEVANDIMGICSKLVETTKEAFTRFRVLLPIEQYNYAAQVKLGPVSDTTALEFALSKSPYLESVEPWLRCDGAGSAGADRMMAYPYDPMVMTALVPMELQTLPPQQKNLEYVVNMIASTGGVICRYPVAVAYADGI